jgi:hypothetical protein
VKVTCKYAPYETADEQCADNLKNCDQYDPELQ